VTVPVTEALFGPIKVKVEVIDGGGLHLLVEGSDKHGTRTRRAAAIEKTLDRTLRWHLAVSWR
jgi:hypothetical protein